MNQRTCNPNTILTESFGTCRTARNTLAVVGNTGVCTVKEPQRYESQKAETKQSTSGIPPNIEHC